MTAIEKAGRPGGGRRKRVLLLAWAVLAVVATMVVVMWTRRPPVRSGRPLVLVASGDTSGWITPCGCTSNQSGGLPRRGSFLAELRQKADVIYVDVGGAGAGTSGYQRVKFEAILLGEMAMGLDAQNLGGAEMALGAAALREAARRSGAALVSCNVSPVDGGRLAEPWRIVSRGGRRIAVTGVVSAAYATGEFRVRPARDAVLAVIAGRREEYDTLVVLAYLPEGELNELAAGLPEADVVIGGPTGQAMRPTRTGPTLLMSATNKGKFLAQVDLSVQPARAVIVEMTQAYADDARQKENVGTYLAELGRQDFPAMQTGLVAAPLGGGAGYRVAGDASCARCHAADAATCARTKHAQAWASLQARGQQVDPSCQMCHSVGYGMPGGFVSMAASADRLNVGCEDCHGPSAAHVANVKIRTPYVARDQCVRCHDEEDSPSFAYQAYWEQIKHGAAATMPAAAPTEIPR